jgi:hypothetical protein
VSSTAACWQGREQEVLTGARHAGREADWDLGWVGPVVCGNCSPAFTSGPSGTLQRHLPGTARQQPLRQLHRLELVPRSLPRHRGQLRAAPRRRVWQRSPLSQRGRASSSRPRLPGAVRGQVLAIAPVTGKPHLLLAIGYLDLCVAACWSCSASTSSARSGVVAW